MSGDGTDDLAILHPKEQFAVVQGEKVVLREFTFFEDYELREHSQPFIDDLMVLFGNPNANFASVDALVAKHIKAVQTMIATSCGKPLQWVRNLSRHDGRAVYDAWWAANGPFFVRCATECLRSDLIAKALAGLMYGQRSEPTTTATMKSSATPTDN